MTDPAYDKFEAKVDALAERIFDKLDKRCDKTEEIIHREVGKLAEYTREQNALIRADVSKHDKSIDYLYQKSESHSIDLGKTKQLAEITAQDVGAKAGAVRGGVISFLISFAMLIINIIILWGGQ